ncbi:MAG: hypothetical protein ACK4RK_14620 [Gemmataceae bacterium]
MVVFAPDILAAVRGLSVTVSGGGLAVGLLLWLFGWWGHRFWIVLAATAGAGLFGLFADWGHGIQPLAAALLIALAAGVLALPLAQLLVFVASGLSAFWVVQAVEPRWQAPLLIFLAGGLVGMLLFRLWIMFLTSVAGTVLMGYSGLVLADKLGKIDALTLVEQSAALLHYGAAGLVLVGVMAQYLLHRWRQRFQASRPNTEEEEEASPAAADRPPRRWWGGKIDAKKDPPQRRAG